MALSSAPPLPQPVPIPQSAAILEKDHYKDKVLLVSSGYDNSIRFWNVDQAYCERMISQTEHTNVNAMAISQSREILASGGYQHIRLWDITTLSSTPLVNFSGISKGVTALDFNSTDKWFFSGDENGQMRVWDIRCSSLHCQRSRSFQTPITSAFLHPNGAEIYVADQSGAIYIWNLQTDAIQRLFITNESFITSVSYDSEGKLLAALDAMGNCFLFKLSDHVPKSFSTKKKAPGLMTLSGFLQPRFMFQAHDKHGLKCSFSPDGTLLATASADATVRFWRTTDLSVLQPTSVAKFIDPFESITNASTGPTFTSSFTSTRTPLYQQVYSEKESPYLAAPFARSFQPPKPPPCYLKPRRTKANCPVCTGKIKSDVDAKSSSASTSGRSVFHSAQCTGASNAAITFLPQLGTSPIQLQPNLNSLSQLTWNSISSPRRDSLGWAGAVNSCNHYSHFEVQPTFRSKLSSGNLIPEADTSGDTTTRSGRKSSHPHHPHHSHDLLNPKGPLQLPAYYAKYLDSELYEFCTRQDAKKDAEALMTDDFEDDVEFFTILKQMDVLGVDEQAPVDEFLADVASHGVSASVAHRESSPTLSPYKADDRRRMQAKAPIEYCCCSCCSICNEAVNPGARSTGDRPRPVIAELPLGKNEWNFSDSFKPYQTLSYPGQRWVWDIKFSADSQYIFTASSDHVVRLWSAFTGKLTRFYLGHSKAVTTLAFSDLI